MSAGSLQITKFIIRAMVIAAIAVSVSNCSKRNPTVDTQAPTGSPRPSVSPPPFPGAGPQGNRRTPQTPPANIPGGPSDPGSNLPYRPGSPGYPNSPISPISPISPGYNNNIRPPGGMPPYSNNITPPGRPNVMPPARPNIIPNPPVVPAQPPGAGTSAINVAMSLFLDDIAGPVVKIAYPPTITGVRAEMLALTGDLGSTSAVVVLEFSNAGKTCKSDQISIGVVSKQFTLTCK